MIKPYPLPFLASKYFTFPDIVSAFENSSPFGLVTLFAIFTPFSLISSSNSTNSPAAANVVLICDLKSDHQKWEEEQTLQNNKRIIAWSLDRTPANTDISVIRGDVSKAFCTVEKLYFPWRPKYNLKTTIRTVSHSRNPSSQPTQHSFDKKLIYLVGISSIAWFLILDICGSLETRDALDQVDDRLLLIK